MLLTTTLPVLLLLNWASIKNAKPSFFPILLLMTLSLLWLLLKMNVIYSFPLHLTSLAEHQVFFARILTLFQGFSPRMLTSFEVWIPLRRCSMLTPGLENQCPLLYTSEANIKKSNLNHNTIKRSQQRNNQPVIRAAFCRLDWGGEKEDLAESRKTFEVAAAQFSVLTRDTAFCFRVRASVYWWSDGHNRARCTKGTFIRHRTMNQRSYWQMKRKCLC